MSSLPVYYLHLFRKDTWATSQLIKTIEVFGYLSTFVRFFCFSFIGLMTQLDFDIWRGVTGGLRSERASKYSHTRNKKWISIGRNREKYQSSGGGGARLPPAKSNMAARGPQNGGHGLERCLPLDFWAF